MVYAQGGGKPAPTGAAAEAAVAAQAAAAQINTNVTNYIFIILGALSVAMIFWRVGIETVKYVRTMASLNSDTQRYFAVPSRAFAKFKKHVLYAPVFGKRHNKEIQLSSAINVGTLPTRLQLFFLAGYFGTNIAFCVISIDWSVAATVYLPALRNRTGILAVVNMVRENGTAYEAIY